MKTNGKDVIGVVGTGTIGIQITYELLRNDYPVVLKTRDEGNRVTAREKIDRLVSRYISQEERSALPELMVTTDFADLHSCSAVIEAVVEDMEVKSQTFSTMSRYVQDGTILASNTSSLSIDRLADSCTNPQRFLGIHFFNPAYKMRLVELIKGRSTSQETLEWAIRFSEALGKQPVVVENSPGFVVNRLLIPQINDAIRVLEKGVAKKQDIDTAVKLGLNHPMGPLELADHIGLDVCLSILETLMSEDDGERFEPAETLLTLVNKGKLGKKTGEGFYEYGRE